MGWREDLKVPTWAPLAVAGVGLFLFGRCSGGGDGELEKLRAAVVTLDQDTARVNAELRTWHDSVVVLDAAFSQEDTVRVRQMEEALFSARVGRTRAERRATSLRSTIDSIQAAELDTVVADFTAANDSLEFVCEQCALRVLGLQGRLVVRDSLIESQDDRIFSDSLRITARDALISDHERLRGGNFSLLGWRINVRCGVGGAAGIDLSGRANVVVGGSCSISP